MRKQLIVIVAGAMLSTSAANADPTSCREAVDHYYKSAVAEVSEAVRNYTTCVSDSRGHDDCSTEFLQLHQAQDEFESAVSEYESECS